MSEGVMGTQRKVEIKHRAVKVMVELHPSFLEKDGKTEFVVLPVEDYENLRAYLEDLEDLLDLRKAIEEEADAPTLSVDEARRELGIS
jgi:hypothetical protein